MVLASPPFFCTHPPIPLCYFSQRAFLAGAMRLSIRALLLLQVFSVISQGFDLHDWGVRAAFGLGASQLGVVHAKVYSLLSFFLSEGLFTWGVYMDTVLSFLAEHTCECGGVVL
jgi:hypothetical protein